MAVVGFGKPARARSKTKSKATQKPLSFETSAGSRLLTVEASRLQCICNKKTGSGLLK
jgi:hypothetical protein